MAAERRGGGKDFTRATGVPGGRGHALEGRAWECAGMRRATIAMRRSIMTTSKWSIKGWKRRNMVASCRGSGVGEEPRDIRMIRLCAVLSRLSEIPTFPFSTFRLSGPALPAAVPRGPCSAPCARLRPCVDAPGPARVGVVAPRARFVAFDLHGDSDFRQTRGRLRRFSTRVDDGGFGRPRRVACRCGPCRFPATGMWELGDLWLLGVMGVRNRTRASRRRE